MIPKIERKGEPIEEILNKMCPVKISMRDDTVLP